MRLSELKIGQTAEVYAFNLEESVKKRLERMGITKGVKITLVRRAPLSDPSEYMIRGIYLALRASETNKIYVK